MQTSLVEWLCIRTPFLKVTTFAKNVAFVERRVALLPNFREKPPMY